MDEGKWKEVKRVFGEALELAGDGRERLLRGSSPEIRTEVEHLLEAHEKAGARSEASAPGAEGPGSVIGRYKLLQEIGEGGFGVVYMAEQQEPVRRKVALKILKLGMDTGQVIARFEAERQALAIMDHPNIAKVLDAGATEAGRPYFVMELVKGISITDYCDQASLDTRERLDLFTSVCRAVQHAHRRGIIHRDLKPTNVLVTLHDGKPVPVVIDFGIAKATDRRLTEKTLFTEFRQMVGTPEYMAPEQAELSSLDIDTRADVYSLGVLLYELLTGSKPFEMKALLEKGWHEILRHIREVDPPNPSTRLSTMGDELSAVAKNRHTQPGLLGKMVRGDLDWIVMKALEKDRTRRYESADAMAQDVERYLQDEPVLATPPSRLYRLRKYVKRHKVGVAAVAAVFLALVVGLVLSALGFYEASRQKAEAVAERDAANQARSAEADARSAADRAAERARSERDAKEAARSDLAKALTRSEGTRLIAQSQAILPKDPSLAVLLAIEGADRAPGFEANQALLDAMEKAPYREVVLDAGACQTAAFGPRGRRVATGHADGKVRISDAETGKVIRVLDSGDGAVAQLQWVHERDTIVSVTTEGDASVWNAATGVRIRTIPAIVAGEERDGAVGSWWAWIAKNGARCVINPPPGGSPRVVNLETGATEFEIPGNSPRAWAISDDGAKCLTDSRDSVAGTSTLTCWGIESKAALHSWTVSQNCRPTLSSDGRHALALGPGNRLMLLDLGTGEVVRRYETDGKHVTGRAFTPDDGRVVIGLSDTVRIVETRSGRVCNEIADVQSGLYAISISPDGERLILHSRMSSSGFNVYCASTGAILATLHGHSFYEQSAFSPDGSRILGHAYGGQVRVWHLGPDPLGFVGRDAFGFRPSGAGGQRAVSASYFRNVPVRIWDLQRRRPTVALDGHRCILGGRPQVSAYAAGASPDGRRVVTGGFFGEVLVWDPATGRKLGGWSAHRAPVWSAGFSPDGTKILTAGQDGTARVWDAASGRPVLVLGDEQPRDAEGGTVTWTIGGCWATYSPDGARILTHNVTVKGARVWDAKDGRLLLHLAASEGLIGAGFSVDGTEVITCARLVESTQTRVWDLATGECRLTLPGSSLLTGGPSSCLSPDGRHIVQWVQSEGLRIHDLESGALVRKLPGVLDGTFSAWYSPDGRVIAARNNIGGRVVVWNAGTGAQVLDRECFTGFSQPEAFTADSRSIIVRMNSGHRLIPIDPLHAARAHRPRDLTSAERERYGLPATSKVPDARMLPPGATTGPQGAEARAVGDFRRLIAGVLAEAADREKAERTLRIAARDVGLPDDAIVLTLRDLGNDRYHAGEFGIAEGLFRAAYRYGRATLAPEHATVERTGQLLADTLNRNGRPEEAELILRELLERAERRFRSWHKDRIVRALGRSLLAQDRPADAEPQFREAKRILERHLGPDAPRHGDARSESLLGDALLRQEKWEEAEAVLLKAWERPVMAAEHWSEEFRTETLDRLIRLYEAWGKPERAAEWRALRKD